MMLKLPAKIISVLFHPLILVTYTAVLMLLMNPYEFGVSSIGEQTPLLLQVFLSTFALPALMVFLMYAIEFIPSVEMPDKQDRIVPYIGVMTFYIASYYFYLKLPGIPVAFKLFMLGVVISLAVAFFINNFSKISIHTVGMGGFLGMIMTAIFFFKQESFPMHTMFGYVRVDMVLILILTFIFSGLVGTSRLLLGSHTPDQLWGGYMVGFLGQGLAFLYMY